MEFFKTSLIAKESEKDLTTWETYLKEKKQKRKKKMKEASKAQESEEDTSEIVILINYILAFTSDVVLSYCSQQRKEKEKDHHWRKMINSRKCVHIAPILLNMVDLELC